MSPAGAGAGAPPPDQPDAAPTDRIAAFLTDIGIPVSFEPLAGEQFLPGIAVRGGGLVVDRDRLAWPGDLLHDAGHVAVTDPAARATLDRVGDDPAEEMAAIAWSWAAAEALRLDPALVFHGHGYGGDGGWVIAAFTDGGGIGVPLLEWFGMTATGERAAAAGVAPFPHMRRWLR